MAPHFLLHLLIDFEIGFGPELGVTAEQVLPHRKQRHKHNPNHVGDEEPEHERRRGIKPVRPRTEQVPEQPEG